MSFDFDLSRGGWRETFLWWRGLPRSQKLVFLVMALPAWLVGIYTIVTRQSESLIGYAAFGVFAAATLLMMLLDRLSRSEPDRGRDS